VDHEHRDLLHCVTDGALNFITTTLDLRAKGMTMMRMPLTVWSVHHAILGCWRSACCSRRESAADGPESGVRVLVPLVVVNGRSWGTRAVAAAVQHLFWFFGIRGLHRDSAGYGRDLADSVDVLAQSRSLDTRRWLCHALDRVFFGFMVWGHHMFMSGMSPYSAFAFSILTMCIGVPRRSRHLTGWDDV